MRVKQEPVIGVSVLREAHRRRLSSGPAAPRQENRSTVGRMFRPLSAARKATLFWRPCTTERDHSMPTNDRRALTAFTALTVFAVIALPGCASHLPAPGAVPSPRQSDCAVAENPNGEPPPEGCVVYDPEQNMADNQRWRDRVAISTDAQSAGDSYVGSVTRRLTDLRNSGTVTAESVQQVFLDEGFPARSIATLGDLRNVGFGVAVSSPTSQEFTACLFGAVGPDGVSVDVGGPIMDGGCLEGLGGH